MFFMFFWGGSAPHTTLCWVPGLFFFTAELGGSAQAFGAANSFASGLGLVSIMLQGIAIARLAEASGSAVLGGVANVVVVRIITGMLVIGLSQAGGQVQAITCFMLAQVQ